MRVAAGVMYNGNAYHGFQKQPGPGLRTIQGELELALAEVADHPVKLVCAGRTDTGVHATQQVIHFDALHLRSERSWLMGTNSYLPKDISVSWVRQVEDDFHARHHAIRRRYRYIISNTSQRPALFMNQVSWFYPHLDVGLMQEAAKDLLGQHDFSSFRGSGCQNKIPVRTIYELTLQRQGRQVILDIEADGFLQHMVRNIMGVLMMIGTGQRAVVWCKQVLEAKDRTLGGLTAPPYGLYLVGVTYPPEIDLPVVPRYPVITLLDD